MQGPAGWAGWGGSGAARSATRARPGPPGAPRAAPAPPPPCPSERSSLAGGRAAPAGTTRQPAPGPERLQPREGRVRAGPGWARGGRRWLGPAANPRARRRPLRDAEPAGREATRAPARRGSPKARHRHPPHCLGVRGPPPNSATRPARDSRARPAGRPLAGQVGQGESGLSFAKGTGRGSPASPPESVCEDTQFHACMALPGLEAFRKRGRLGNPGGAESMPSSPPAGLCISSWAHGDQNLSILCCGLLR